MSKKRVRKHLIPSQGMWRATRLSGKVKNTGIKPVRKVRRARAA